MICFGMSSHLMLYLLTSCGNCAVSLHLSIVFTLYYLLLHEIVLRCIFVSGVIILGCFMSC